MTITRRDSLSPNKRTSVYLPAVGNSDQRGGHQHRVHPDVQDRDQWPAAHPAGPGDRASVAAQHGENEETSPQKKKKKIKTSALILADFFCLIWAKEVLQGSEGGEEREEWVRGERNTALGEKIDGGVKDNHEGGKTEHFTDLCSNTGRHLKDLALPPTSPPNLRNVELRDPKAALISGRVSPAGVNQRPTPCCKNTVLLAVQASHQPRS